MLKYIPWKQMLSILVEDHRILDVLIEVLRAMLEAGSARWSDIARKVKGTEAAAYKRLQRLVARFDPWPVVTRLCAENAPFGIGDLTEIERPQARRTAYVGWLPPKAKGRRPRRGFWVLLLGVPLRGRVLPCGWWAFSSRTLEQEASSQHREIQQAMERMQGLLQGRPLILDRGFHSRAFLAWQGQRGLPFIVRI